MHQKRRSTSWIAIAGHRYPSGFEEGVNSSQNNNNIDFYVYEKIQHSQFTKIKMYDQSLQIQRIQIIYKNLYFSNPD